MRVAAVDIGTNTVRLLIGSVVGGDRPHMADIERHEVITRLGAGLDASGILSDEAMARALSGLGHYAGLIDEAGVDIAGGVATAATRTAENGADFAKKVGDVLGFTPRIIDGVEEARLTFRGATNGRKGLDPTCVIDVGGGSTEFVVGTSDPEYAMSVDIGSVRLTERIRLLGLEDADQVRAYVDELFATVHLPYPPALVLGSGGTFTTLAAVHFGIPPQEIDLNGNLELTFPQLQSTVDRLSEMSVAEIAQMPGVDPARAGVLQAGAICAERAVAVTSTGATRISVSDILDGLALELVQA